MDSLQVAAVDGSQDALLAGVRELPVTQMWLLVTPEFHEDAERLRNVLDSLHVTTRVAPIEGDPVRGVIRSVSEAAGEATARGANVHVNVSSGPRHLVAAATAAAFMHGLHAFVVIEDHVSLLPVLRFPYHELVSSAKLAILHAIAQRPDGAESLHALAVATGLEKSLLSYHVRGVGDSRGLERLGLVRVERGPRGRLSVRLTPVGEVFAAAYSPPVAPVGQSVSSTDGDELGRV